LHRSELQKYANQAAEGLRSLASEFEKNRELLSKIIAVPAVNFPIHTRYMVAEHLLATGVSLPVQEWLESGEDYAREAERDEILSDYERRRLWFDALNITGTVGRKQKWGADYTLAEVQAGVDSISTGLERELVVPDIDEEDYEEEFEDEGEEEAGDEGNDDDGEAMDIDRPNAANAERGVVDPSSAIPPMTMDVLMRYMSTAKDP
jgi:hypothetical protein